MAGANNPRADRSRLSLTDTTAIADGLLSVRITATGSLASEQLIETEAGSLE
jgi:hypothetical protein